MANQTSQQPIRIGIDLGGTKIEGIALAANGTVHAQRRIATPRNDYDGTLKAIAGLVDQIEQKANRDGGMATVGVAMPGAISPLTGLVKNANSTWLNGHPFDRDLAVVLDRPVRLANDANCLAVSEAVDGAGAGAHLVFAVILGTGVGGGIAIDGKALTGRNAIAGEWGHNPLPWPTHEEASGSTCYCGKTGCIETWLSGPGLTADHLYTTGRQRSAEEIATDARAGDTSALATLERHRLRLARALASVVNVLDPDVIVIGGGLSKMPELYRLVPPLMAQWCFSDGVATPIRPALHGDASGVRGAAWLWPAGDTPA